MTTEYFRPCYFTIAGVKDNVDCGTEQKKLNFLARNSLQPHNLITSYVHRIKIIHSNMSYEQTENHKKKDPL